MTYKIYFGGDAGSEEKVLSRLSDISVNKNPTALSDWSATVPYMPSIDENLLDEIYLYFNDEKLFRGFLESAQHDENNSTTKLKGRGGGVELLHQTTEVDYQGWAAHDAIEVFWDNWTDADATVRSPSTTSEETAFGADMENTFEDLFTLDARGGEWYDEPYYYEAFYTDQDGILRMHQTGFTFDEPASNGTASRITGDQYSAGEAALLDTSGDYVEFKPGFEYYVPGAFNNIDWDPEDEGYEVFVRLSYDEVSNDDIRLAFTAWDHWSDDDTPAYPREWDISGNGGPEWVKVWDDSGPFIDTHSEAEANRADSTMQLELLGDADNGSQVVIDAIAVVDDNFDYEASDSLNEDGYYNRPETHSYDAAKQTDELSIRATDFWEVYLKSTERHEQFRNGIHWSSSTNAAGERGPHTSEYGEPQSMSSFLYDDIGEGGKANAVSTDVYFAYPADTYSQSGDSVSIAYDEISFRHTEVNDVALVEDVIAGTYLDILQELHDIGGYQFVEVEPNGTYESFPIETRHEEPDWRLLSASRKIDFTDYANKYSVRGNVSSGGVVTVTEADFGEIDDIGNEVHRYHRVTGTSSKADLRRRARRLLKESTASRKQSGSATATPKFIPTGYNYPISRWAECFDDNSRIGWNALCFEGPDGRADRLQRIDDPYSDYYDGTVRDGAWEFLVRPEMDHLSNDDYMVLASTEAAQEFIRIYGDGSVDWTPPGTSHGRISTPAGTVSHEETTRLSFHYDAANSQMRILEGQNEVASTSVSPESRTYGNLWLGARWTQSGISGESDASNAYKGGLDDIRYWLAEEAALSYDFSQPYQELDADTLPNNGVENEIYYKLDDEQNITRAPNDQLRPIGERVDTRIVDDFEDGNLDEYASTKYSWANFDTSSSAAYQGSYGLEATVDGDSFSTSGLNWYPEAGDEIKAKFRLDDFTGSSPRWELAWAAQSENGLSDGGGYSLDMRANDVRFNIRNASGTSDSETSLWEGRVTRTTVDDFEDGDISEWDNSSYYGEATSSAAHDGNYGLHIDSFGEIYSEKGGELNDYPEQGDEFEFWMRNEFGDQRPSGNQLIFAWQGENDGPAYAIHFAHDRSVSIRRLEEPEPGIYEMLADSGPGEVSTDTWYHVQVRWEDGNQGWGQEGDIFVDVYDENGTNVTSVQANDTSFSSGGLGWKAFGESTLEADSLEIIHRTATGGGGGDTIPAGTMIDSFEDNDFSEYLDNDHWGIGYAAGTSPDPVDGDHHLDAEGYGYKHSPLGGGLNHYPERGETFEVLINNAQFENHGSDPWSYWWVHWALQDGTVEDPSDSPGYRIYMSDTTVRLQKSTSSGDWSTLSSTNFDFSTVNEWYALRVDFDESGTGDITVEIVDVDTDGNETSNGTLASTTSTDTEYDQGGIGFLQNTAIESFYDAFRVPGDGSIETSWSLGDWYEVTIDWSDKGTFDIDVVNLSSGEKYVDAYTEDPNRLWEDGGIGFTATNTNVSWDDILANVSLDDPAPRGAIITGAEYDAEYAKVEEVGYTLGNDASMELNFDLEGLDRALSDINRRVDENRDEL